MRFTLTVDGVPIGSTDVLELLATRAGSNVSFPLQDDQMTWVSQFWLRRQGNDGLSPLITVVTSDGKIQLDPTLGDSAIINLGNGVLIENANGLIRRLGYDKELPHSRLWRNKVWQLDLTSDAGWVPFKVGNRWDLQLPSPRFSVGVEQFFILRRQI